MGGAPLAGLRVVELAGVAPGPFCGMLLGDMGATVVRVERPAGAGDGDPGDSSPVHDHGRPVAEVSLKAREDRDCVLDLVADSDGFIGGLRPGVTERPGVGPPDCLRRNPRLIYGRMTGWGQTGPYAPHGRARHHVPRHQWRAACDRTPWRGPRPPVNRPGDFCGGGMLLAVGVLAALPEAQRTGRGRVVDAAIVDGAALLSGMLHGFLSQGLWNDERGTNLLDAGAPFYDVYRRADDRYVAVGALERRFFDNLARELGFTDDPTFQGDHLDPSTWPAIREALKAAFARKPRDAWARPAARRRVPRCSRPVAHRNENRPPTSGRADVCGCGRRDAARACATIRRAVVRVNTNTDCKYETGSPAYAV